MSLLVTTIDRIHIFAEDIKDSVEVLAFDPHTPFTQQFLTRCRVGHVGNILLERDDYKGGSILLAVVITISDSPAQVAILNPVA
jgi:hypothetical protein